MSMFKPTPRKFLVPLLGFSILAAGPLSPRRRADRRMRSLSRMLAIVPREGRDLARFPTNRNVNCGDPHDLFTSIRAINRPLRVRPRSARDYKSPQKEEDSPPVLG